MVSTLFLRAILFFPEFQELKNHGLSLKTESSLKNIDQNTRRYFLSTNVGYRNDHQNKQVFVDCRQNEVKIKYAYKKS